MSMDCWTEVVLDVVLLEVVPALETEAVLEVVLLVVCSSLRLFATEVVLLADTPSVEVEIPLTPLLVLLLLLYVLLLMFSALSLFNRVFDMVDIFDVVDVIVELGSSLSTRRGPLASRDLEEVPAVVLEVVLVSTVL